MLRQLPDWHVRTPALGSIKYVDQVKEEDRGSRHRRFPTQLILGQWDINHETGEGHASIYRQHANGNPEPYKFRDSILHEVGHATYHQLSEADKAEWAALHQQSVILMNAQSRVADEAFCHMYAAYFQRHALVKAGFPHLSVP